MSGRRGSIFQGKNYKLSRSDGERSVAMSTIAAFTAALIVLSSIAALIIISGPANESTAQNAMVSSHTNYLPHPGNDQLSTASPDSRGTGPYLPGYYTVTFNETGLQPGIAWYVNITNSVSSGPIYTNSYSVNLFSGNYQYTIGTTDNDYKAQGGQFKVGSSPEYIPVIFSEVQYDVNFTLQNTSFPSHTSWYVNLTNGPNSGSILGNSYTILLSNGTYSYSIASSNNGFRVSPGSQTQGSGSFNVDGRPVDMNITFSKVSYRISINETGLPPGANWSVVSPNGTYLNTTGSSIVTYSQNGTYTYKIPNLTEYYASNSSVTIKVNGHAAGADIHFTRFGHITGSVKPGHANVTINGQSVKLKNGTFNVSVSSGTYRVVATQQGYSTYSNNVTVSSGQEKDLNVTLQIKGGGVSSPLSGINVETVLIIGGVVAGGIIAGIVGYRLGRRDDF